MSYFYCIFAFFSLSTRKTSSVQLSIHVQPVNSSYFCLCLDLNVVEYVFRTILTFLEYLRYPIKILMYKIQLVEFVFDEFLQINDDQGVHLACCVAGIATYNQEHHSWRHEQGHYDEHGKVNIWAASWENEQCGFWTGPIQIRLYSHRSRLEAWNFGFKKKSDCTIPVAKTKALISFTAKLICVFVFAYADCWFSHVAAHI